MAVEFTGGVRSYFDGEVANVYDEAVAHQALGGAQDAIPLGHRSGLEVAELEIRPRMRILLQDVVKRFGGHDRGRSRASRHRRRRAVHAARARRAAARPRCCASSPGSTAPDGGEICFGERRVDAAAALRAQHRHGLPELRALAAHDGRREHHLRAAPAQAARPRRSPRALRAGLRQVNLAGLEPSAIRASSRAASSSGWRWPARWC